MQKKKWLKVALMSAPILALVISNMLGLGAELQGQLESVLVDFVTIVAGAFGVTGIAMNNDKPDENK